MAIGGGAPNWKKGQSGNPGGRPRGATLMAKMIREQTHDGALLVAHALDVWRDPHSTESHRQWAHDWLTDRGFGRAAQSIDLTIGGEVTVARGLDLRTLTTEQLAALEALDSGDDDKPDGER